MYPHFMFFFNTIEFVAYAFHILSPFCLVKAVEKAAITHF